jgi:hypothetical protein
MRLSGASSITDVIAASPIMGRHPPSDGSPGTPMERCVRIGPKRSRNETVANRDIELRGGPRQLDFSRPRDTVGTAGNAVVPPAAKRVPVATLHRHPPTLQSGPH